MYAPIDLGQHCGIEINGIHPSAISCVIYICIFKSFMHLPPAGNKLLHSVICWRNVLSIRLNDNAFGYGHISNSAVDRAIGYFRYVQLQDQTLWNLISWIPNFFRFSCAGIAAPLVRVNVRLYILGAPCIIINGAVCDIYIITNVKHAIS